MTRSKSAHRNRRPLNDFQVYKGLSENTMQAFGPPVMAHHEAQLIARDDQASTPAGGAPFIYAIYKRSENRIIQILQTPEVQALPLAA